jgi:hypothetical protein
MMNDIITQNLTKSVCDQRNCSGCTYPVIPDDWFMEYVAISRIVIREYLYSFFKMTFLLINPRNALYWPEPKKDGFKEAEFRNRF